MATQFSEADTFYMRLALNEARKGQGRTSPNPCVGAIIVKDGAIVARGYHKKAGGPHAEIEALKKAGGQARGATMYVTLEPCSHQGKTGPCSQAVAACGVARVIIGMLDPNPLVDGRGADYLRAAGVEVRHGVLEDQCRELNRPFVSYITRGRPWVVLKAGLSLDGRISLRKKQRDALTGEESQRQVHLLRDRCDAILVGINTVAIDDPALTVRLSGRKRKNPIRIILDTHLSISPEAVVVSRNQDGLTWVCCGEGAESRKKRQLADLGVTVIPVDVDVSGRIDLVYLLAQLGKRQISSLLVEGGAAVHGSFLRAGLADYLQFFYAPILVGDGGTPVIDELFAARGREQAVRLEGVKKRRFGNDFMICGELKYPSMDTGRG
jgi:diaminohydroxyphosphoribosylaminopyrimidine deaminase/5-amino-6-(5-phosphoribosylamino)uracil reductase